MMDKKFEGALAQYKRVRDGLLHADEDRFVYHTREFVRVVRENCLTKPIIDKLPRFDVNAWLKKVAEHPESTWGRAEFDPPTDPDERLVVYFDFLESFVSPAEAGQLSVLGFGQLFGFNKHDKAVAAAMDLIARPFCERMDDEVRAAAQIANPAVRELAGVPLNRIPAADETGIFLSHKTVDKPLVRPFYDALETLGFSPWLDEEAMRPGDTLHRAISSGFDKACAVIFFITSNFKDEQWLRREIDEAVDRKIKLAARFSVITLLFDGAQVPRALQNELYVNVGNQVDALRQVIRGLPIELGPPRWRE